MKRLLEYGELWSQLYRLSATLSTSISVQSYVWRMQDSHAPKLSHLEEILLRWIKQEWCQCRNLNSLQACMLTDILILHLLPRIPSVFENWCTEHDFTYSNPMFTEAVSHIPCCWLSVRCEKQICSHLTMCDANCSITRGIQEKNILPQRLASPCCPVRWTEFERNYSGDNQLSVTSSSSMWTSIILMLFKWVYRAWIGGENVEPHLCPDNRSSEPGASHFFAPFS